MLEQVLPIGTVVMLEDATKRVMIVGYQYRSAEDTQKVYDYIGCLYPEGFIGTDKMFLFDHAQIAHIFAYGLQNDEQIAFREKLQAEIGRLDLQK